MVNELHWFKQQYIIINNQNHLKTLIKLNLTTIGYNHYLSSNPNITWEIIQDNPNFKWVEIRNNKFLYDDVVFKKHYTLYKKIINEHLIDNIDLCDNIISGILLFV